jgi:hypothetical protein
LHTAIDHAVCGFAIGTGTVSGIEIGIAGPTNPDGPAVTTDDDVAMAELVTGVFTWPFG